MSQGIIHEEDHSDDEVASPQINPDLVRDDELEDQKSVDDSDSDDERVAKMVSGILDDTSP